ncbi:MAG: hypothetical protein AB2L14_37205 [Candidatus Xenobiia bacterium LiM19]
MKSRAPGIAALLWIASFVIMIISRNAGYPHDKTLWFISVIVALCAVVFTIIILVRSSHQFFLRLKNKEKITISGGFWYWAAIGSFLCMILFLALYLFMDQQDPGFLNQFYNVIRLTGFAITFLSLPILIVYMVSVFLKKETKKLSFVLLFFMVVLESLLINNEFEMWETIKAIMSRLFSPGS